MTEQQRRQNEFNKYLEESGQTADDINVDVAVYGTGGTILFAYDGMSSVTFKNQITPN